MIRVRLTKWGKDHFENPKKKGFTLCGIMIPWKRREPQFKGLCVVCRKKYQMQIGSHPVVDGH
jgi:hypothetical protein